MDSPVDRKAGTMFTQIRTMTLALVLLVGAVLTSCGAYTYKSATVEPPDQAYNIVLTDQHNQPFELTSLRGKVVLVFFGYTNCPDVCPATMSDLQLVKNRLGDQADKLEIVFVSVDPERDTPEKLTRFANLYDPTIHALTGTNEALAAVYKAYGAGAERVETPNSALGYVMNHTATITVLDKQGMRRLLIGFGAPIEDTTADLLALIAE